MKFTENPLIKHSPVPAAAAATTTTTTTTTTTYKSLQCGCSRAGRVHWQWCAGWSTRHWSTAVGVHSTQQ